MFDPLVDKTLELLNDQYIEAKNEGFNVRVSIATSVCWGAKKDCSTFSCAVGLPKIYIWLERSQILHTWDAWWWRSPKNRECLAQTSTFYKINWINVKYNYRWVAVVRGAVARGIEMAAEDATLKSRVRRHYGVSTSQPFSAVKHSENDAYIDSFDGEKKASHQMSWLIKKGDTLHSTKPKIGSVVICRRFGIEDPRAFHTTIVACDDDEVPQRQRDIHDGSLTNFQSIWDQRC
jgi:hypothetical protein